MIVIRKVADPHGCWGNMAPYPVVYRGKEYRTTEALFQSLRFDDEEVIEAIRAEKSPMGAKFVTKRYRAKMVAEPRSEKDLDNMRLCLRLKVEQHPELARALRETGEELIVEDCTKRQRGAGLFWGAALVDGEWRGQNWLGKLWMDTRASLPRIEGGKDTAVQVVNAWQRSQAGSAPTSASDHRWRGFAATHHSRACSVDADFDFRRESASTDTA